MSTIENTVWIEKYRPGTLEDVIGHDKTIDRLSRYVDDTEVPHMIFAGPPGTGKTAAIVAFAREVFGSSWKQNMMEMNASDERGIDTIREKVKRFARSSPVGEADYQIIFMDEADQLTKDAQASLRRIMEEFSDGTRFFMSCNYPNQIIEAIQSRCSVFRFGRLTNGDIRHIVNRVVEEEDLEIEEEARTKIIESSKGDARTAINALQSSSFDGVIDSESVSVSLGTVNEELIEDIVDLAISGKADDAMEKLDTELLKEGASSNVMADSFLRVIKRKEMPAPGKMKILDKLGEVDWRVRQGANPGVQWHSFISDIHVGYHLTLGKYGDD